MFWLLTLPFRIVFGLFFGLLALPFALLALPFALIFVLPFLILRLVFKVVFGLVMLPIALLLAAMGVGLAFLAVFFAIALPLLPFALIGLFIWAIVRLSRPTFA